MDSNFFCLHTNKINTNIGNKYNVDSLVKHKINPRILSDTSFLNVYLLVISRDRNIIKVNKNIKRLSTLSKKSFA